MDEKVHFEQWFATYSDPNVGSVETGIQKHAALAAWKARAALTQPAEGGEVVAYRETITGRLCDPDDTHRRNYPMCYRPLTYADTATQADGSFTAGDVDAYCARARTETANECQQALQACIDAITAFQDPAENYPQDTQEFRDLDAAMKLAQQQISWIAPPASQEQADREQFMAGYAAAEADAAVCQVPPHGWSCTRKAGHEGPCAAVETDDAELVQRGMDRLRESHHNITSARKGGE